MPFKDLTPTLEMHSEGWPFTVVETIEYYPFKHVWPKKIEVPPGTITDLASVPRMFWRVFPPFGRYSLAAIVHDHLYRSNPYNMKRKKADEVFLSAMQELGVSWLTRTLVHRAVRVGGWKPWNAHRAGTHKEQT